MKVAKNFRFETRQYLLTFTIWTTEQSNGVFTDHTGYVEDLVIWLNPNCILFFTAFEHETPFYSSGRRGWSRDPRLVSMDRIKCKLKLWEGRKESLLVAPMDTKLRSLLHSLTSELKKEVRALKRDHQHSCAKQNPSSTIYSVYINKSLLLNYTDPSITDDSLPHHLQSPHCFPTKVVL